MQHRIAFNVFHQSATFRKTAPGPPAYVLCVCEYVWVGVLLSWLRFLSSKIMSGARSFNDEPPSLADLNALTVAADGHLLRFALVSGGNVIFYGLWDFDFPIFED